MSMTAAASPLPGPPEAKRFKMELPTQVVVDSASVNLCNSAPSPAEPPVGGEQSPAGPSSARSSNGSSNGSSIQESKENSTWRLVDEDEPQLNTGSLMDIISKSILNNVFKMDESHRSAPGMDHLSPPRAPAGTSPAISIPGALAVAQSPAAQLFGEDDWSWHRNPAAAIRSGGTNKQTPVWKYFVYNKVENLSRCIIGDCTYQLKGPHTSTLACHLKKHPAEYAEFQKLKVDYTKDRNGGQMPPSPSSSHSGSSGGSASSNGAMPKMPEMMQMGPMGPMGHVGHNTPHQKPKEKPANNNRNISSIVNALNRQAANTAANNNAANAAAAAAAMSPAAMMQSMLQAGMNPAGFPFMFNPAAIPTSTANLNLANQILQQQQQAINNLNGQNGHFMMNKKWKREERKQRELEVRLALMISAGHIDTNILQNPFFRDFLEAAQPKFNVPEDPTIVEQIISANFARCVSSIKTELAIVRRVTLMVDLLRVPSNTPQDEQLIKVCVGAAYLAAPSNKLETCLLAIRTAPLNANIGESIRDIVQQIANEYDISLDRITRVVTNGYTDLVNSAGEKNTSSIPKHLEPICTRLMHHLSSVIECSTAVESVKKAMYAMVFAVVTRPQMMQSIGKMTGHPVSLPLTDPFLSLAEAVLAVKEELVTVMESADEKVDRLIEEQWKMIECLCSLFSQFRSHLNLLNNGEVATIDGVVPALMQLQITLEKDMAPLGDLAEDLRRELREQTARVFDVQSVNFDGTFLQATALNPQLAVLLDDDQLTYTRNAIELLVQEKMRQSEESAGRKSGKGYMGVDSLLANVMDRKNSEDCLSECSSGGSAILYPDLLHAAQQKRQQERPPKNRFAEAIVNSYFDEILSPPSSDSLLTPFGSPCSAFANRHLPPIAFWQSNAHKCAPLADIATELLSLPATTLSLERIFSISGDSSPTPGAPFDPLLLPNSDRLERDVMLRYNKEHVSIKF